jgi:hypothetical protein
MSTQLGSEGINIMLSFVKIGEVKATLKSINKTISAYSKHVQFGELQLQEMSTKIY